MTALMVACVLMPSAIGCAPGAAAGQSGRVVYYSKGVMERVALNRTNPHHRGYVPGFRLRYDVDGYASRPSCKTIGAVWLASVNGGPAYRYQQVDCAQSYHYAQQVRSGLQLEIDYQSARRVGIVRAGRGRVTVWRAQ